MGRTDTMNLKEWRKRREREASKPSAKIVQLKPETLLERLQRYARLSGSKYTERSHKVECVMPNGVVVTVYREPYRYRGGRDPILLYGMVFYPYRRYGRWKYFDWRCAKRLYDRLAQAIDEL